jgi:hypothetical protein
MQVASISPQLTHAPGRTCTRDFWTPGAYSVSSKMLMDTRLLLLLLLLLLCEVMLLELLLSSCTCSRSSELSSLLLLLLLKGVEEGEVPGLGDCTAAAEVVKALATTGPKLPRSSSLYCAFLNM